MYIYCGDGGNLQKRVRTNHCAGNVEGSSLRKSVALALGFPLLRTVRPTGSTKVRIDLPNSKAGEATVTAYIRTGSWQFVLCENYAEAHDFQWYAIEQLNPLLNRDRQAWNLAQEERYQQLFTQLLNSPAYFFHVLAAAPTGPGVYVLSHTVALAPLVVQN